MIAEVVIVLTSSRTFVHFRDAVDVESDLMGRHYYYTTRSSLARLSHIARELETEIDINNNRIVLRRKSNERIAELKNRTCTNWLPVRAAAEYVASAIKDIRPERTPERIYASIKQMFIAGSGAINFFEDAYFRAYGNNMLFLSTKRLDEYAAREKAKE